MVDGTGMCGGCRVTVGGKAQFACVDGPCFDAHEVDFDVAMRRNKAYVREEKQALDRAGLHGTEGCADARQACGKDPDAGARGAAARPRLPRGERRLHGGPRRLRGRALPALPGTGLRGRLPGERADPGVHPRGGDGRHGRRREDPALGQPAARDLRPRLPAGVAVRGRMQPRQALQPGGDRPPRALRRRLGAHAAARRPRRRSRARRRSPSSAPAPRGWSAPASSRGSATRSRSTRRCTRAGGVLRYGIPEFRLPKASARLGNRRS